MDARASEPMDPGRLLILGYGYSARAVARRLIARGWTVAGTTRRDGAQTAIAADGVEPVAFDGVGAAEAIAAATHVLACAPPGADGDPALAAHGRALAAAPGLRWIGYLSTTGVYGDAGGAWVDEASPLAPVSERGRRRVAAEAAWRALAEARGAALAIFRLPGIYGPGRSALEGLRDGTAKRIVKPGQVFSRIHVADIARAVEAAIERNFDGPVNLADDEPAASADVTAHAARLLQVEPPPEIPFEAAAASMSEMALSFYAESKRVSNARMKAALGVAPDYPTYREGLAAILAAEPREA